MQPRRYPRKNRAPLRAGFVADRDHIGKAFAGLHRIEHRLRFVSRDVDPQFAHCFYNDWIELPRLETGAVGLKFFTAYLIEQRLRHLTAGAIVNANEQNIFLSHEFEGESSSPFPGCNSN